MLGVRAGGSGTVTGGIDSAGRLVQVQVYLSGLRPGAFSARWVADGVPRLTPFTRFCRQTWHSNLPHTSYSSTTAVD